MIGGYPTKQSVQILIVKWENFLLLTFYRHFDFGFQEFVNIPMYSINIFCPRLHYYKTTSIQFK
ncbi:MAG: hypothetical protein CMH46_10435 [Muricauda sp.]|nr:hypothetical protein [Allomuricauda sp.]